MVKNFWELCKTFNFLIDFLKKRLLIFSCAYYSIYYELWTLLDTPVINSTFLLVLFFSFSLKFSCLSINPVKEKSWLVQEKAPIQITALMKGSSGNCCPSNFLVARIFSVSRSFWYKSLLQLASNIHQNECISFISKDYSLLVLLKHICVWVRLRRGSSLYPRDHSDVWF